MVCKVLANRLGLHAFEFSNVGSSFVQSMFSADSIEECLPKTDVDIVKKITISALRSKCCAILRRIQRTRQLVQITRFGKPIAEIKPATNFPES